MNDVPKVPDPLSVRVLHLNSSLSGGGTDDQCVKLVQALHRAGLPVWIAGPEGQEFSQVIRRLELPFLPTGDEGFLKTRFILQAAKLIRRHKIQIVHGHHGRDIWPTILAARLSGVRPKIVLTRHLAKSPASWPSRWFLLSQCDALIAVSDFAAHVLRDGDYDPQSPVAERHARPPIHGDHSKIHIIYGGIDTDRFRPTETSPLRAEWGLRPMDYVFAMMGGYYLPVGKGQREFLQAAAQVHNAIPNARFLIVGRGNMAELLQGDIKRLGLTGKAWLTPFCDNMPQAMNAIDCLVHSQIATEAMTAVVCDAQACGRPVIASNLDGIPEALAIGGLGQLVKPGSIMELAAAMRHWAGQPAPSPLERTTLNQRVAERFSLEAASRRYLAFYQTLAGCRS
jgi:glycosyltransferase involved in cell wall biosynthesis